MAYKRKTWQQKLHNGIPPKVVIADKKFGDVPEGATMLVASPEMVAAYISSIPYGHDATLQQMRKDMAAANNAQYTCPVTSGIFLRIVAEAAYEELQAGKHIEAVVPFWRMIDSKAPVAKKLTFGTDIIQRQRQAEGSGY